MAEEAPSSIVYVEGGESFIAEEADGQYVITIQDIIPFVHIKTGERSSLMPVELLTTMTKPLHVALVYSGAENESTSMVEVSNLSLSDGNAVLTIVVKPLEFYDGEMLNFFESEKSAVNTITTGQYGKIGIYIEDLINPLDNAGNCGECFELSTGGWYQACCYQIGEYERTCNRVPCTP